MGTRKPCARTVREDRARRPYANALPCKRQAARHLLAAHQKCHRDVGSGSAKYLVEWSSGTSLSSDRRSPRFRFRFPATVSQTLGVLAHDRCQKISSYQHERSLVHGLPPDMRFGTELLAPELTSAPCPHTLDQQADSQATRDAVPYLRPRYLARPATGWRRQPAQSQRRSALELKRAPATHCRGTAIGTLGNLDLHTPHSEVARRWQVQARGLGRALQRQGKSINESHSTLRYGPSRLV